MSDANPGRRPARGRPIDPDIDNRVIAAAVEVYAEVGWAGFTFDAIVARAKVGKAAIYRRWPTKQELLTRSVQSFNAQQGMPDTGSIRQDLTEMAERFIENLQTPYGLAELRLQLEAKIYPDILGRAMDPVRHIWIESARKSIADAIARGELPATVSPGMIFDIVRGAIINRYLLVPTDRQERFFSAKAEFARDIVNTALSSVREPSAESIRH